MRPFRVRVTALSSFPLALSMALLVPRVSAQVSSFGSGCPSAAGAVPTISVCGSPFAGHPIDLAVTGEPGKLAYFMLSFQNQSFAGVTLPLPLTAVGNPGCMLLVPPEFAAPVQINGLGEAHLTVPDFFPVPTTLYAQSAVLFGTGGSLLGGITEGIQVDVVHATSTTRGVCDAFALPVELTTLGPALSSWQAINLPNHLMAEFDTPDADRLFLCTVPVPPGTSPSTTSMTLRLQLRAVSQNNNGAWNDEVHISLQGGQFTWSAPISSLHGANGTWVAGQTLQLCLDLDNLPVSGSGAASVLAATIAAGEIDVFIYDDTIVDCATLIAN